MPCAGGPRPLLRERRVYGSATPGGADKARRDRPARPFGCRGLTSTMRAHCDEHDQRLHETGRAEENRVAVLQQEAKAQDVEQPAAAGAQHTPRLGRTLRELTAAGAARGGEAAGERGGLNQRPPRPRRRGCPGIRGAVGRGGASRGLRGCCV
ncbi:hypothetical protein P7K49_016922 [Saguinus oedipus]|uniref:Uncharacterized protein n=1 Tax=Saguinus oedipus TaxID=9490 RepID=A0ABQ9VFI9_SAGOE|nr:hypothetical protein P7K49_016922 [Saguinus oedipus]